MRLFHRCPSIGTLRCALDHPNPQINAHVATCPRCAAAMARLQQNAALAQSMLDQLAATPAPDPAVMLAQLRQRRTTSVTRTRWGGKGESIMARRFRSARTRVALVGTVLITGLALLVTFVPVSALADELINRFRVQQFAAITIPMDAMNQIAAAHSALTPEEQQALQQELAQVAQFSTTLNEQSVHEVNSLADAARILGRTPASTTQVPGALAGVTPRIGVSDAGTATLTINVAKAQEFASKLGIPLSSLPNPQTNPTVTITLHVPAGVVQVYEQGDQKLAIGEMESPELDIPASIDTEALREDLLSIPGLPPDVVAQIRAVHDWQHTLIIPVPSGATTQQVTVHGVPGLLISGPQGSAVLWQQNGILHGVVGTFDSNTVLRVAQSVH